MAQTAASFAAVMKDVWTSDTLIKQFEDKNLLLSRFESQGDNDRYAGPGADP